MARTFRSSGRSRRQAKDRSQRVREAVTPAEAADLLGVERDGPKARCVFHGDGQERTPSLYFYPDHFYCFSCGAHGTSVDLVCKVRGCDWQQALDFLEGLSRSVETSGSASGLRASIARGRRGQDRRGRGAALMVESARAALLQRLLWVRWVPSHENATRALDSVVLEAWRVFDEGVEHAERTGTATKIERAAALAVYMVDHVWWAVCWRGWAVAEHRAVAERMLAEAALEAARIRKVVASEIEKGVVRSVC